MPPPNRLIHETSLYLKQHAHNPVDWHPWGPEALAKAKELDRPIFLSIGYSACHWCHVMEHESFEDEATAKLLNENFVCIKVDREERPDLDTIYMNALQVLTREGGGWPLSVFLTPDLMPFYAGTYYPPDERYAAHGRPSFKRLLLSIADAWKNRRDHVTEVGKNVAEYLAGTGKLTRDPFYKQIACETLDYVMFEMESSEGGFFSTQDADSEGEEGKFYVWSEKEIRDLLGPDLGEFACRVWGVSERGNFEGHNI